MHGTIWFAPEAPIENFASPSFTQTVGHILEEFILLPPCIEVGYPGRGSKYETELFIITPVLGKTTLEPNLFNNVYVKATILPSASTELI